ncbi:MAG: hypothetical protein ACPL6F_04485, partial [Anaerolineales bacterium]
MYFKPLAFLYILTSLIVHFSNYSNIMAMRNGRADSFVAYISISQPKPNQALQGIVNIVGSTNVHDFAHATLEFSYQ